MGSSLERLNQVKDEAEERLMTTTILAERIEQQIHVIWGHKVMLDIDLANVYKVSTKLLNEQVKRNINRFLSDVMFQLSSQEFSD